MNILLDTPPPELPAAPLEPSLGTITGTEIPPGVKIVASWERPRLDSAWQLLLDGDFESDCGGWRAAREERATRAAPVVTAHRAHTSRCSAHMTATDLGGRQPPGPYPDNANRYLFSPAFNLSWSAPHFDWTLFSPTIGAGKAGRDGRVQEEIRRLANLHE